MSHSHHDEEPGHQHGSAATASPRRAEILAAAANGVVLGITAIGVIIEAARRFAAPSDIRGLPMLVVAGIGLLVNLVAARILAGGQQSLNVRAAAMHVAADAAGSVAAIIAAVLILVGGWTIADPITSIVISIERIDAPSIAAPS